MRRPAAGTRLVLGVAALVAAAVLAGPRPAGAHTGHDHGAEAPPPPPAHVAPRSSVLIGNQEVVVTYERGIMTAYLHRYSDGRPTEGAAVEAVVDFLPGTLSEIAPGIYQSDNWVLASGSSDVELSYEVSGRKASATLTLVLPEADAAEAKRAAAAGGLAAPGPSTALWAALGGLGMLVLAGVLSGVLWRRLRHARGTAGRA